MNAPCPNSVIEALNHGIPVIGYNQGSMREIVKKNYGCLINVSSTFKINKVHLKNKIKKISFNYNFFNNNLKLIDKKFKLSNMLYNYVSEIRKT